MQLFSFYPISSSTSHNMIPYFIMSKASQGLKHEDIERIIPSKKQLFFILHRFFYPTR